MKRCISQRAKNRGESGQATIEMLLVFPLGVLACLVMAQSGVVVADQLALRQAAASVAVAHIAGDDTTRTLHSSLPERMRGRTRIHNSHSRVILDYRPRGYLHTLAPDVRLRATAVFATERPGA